MMFFWRACTAKPLTCTLAVHKTFSVSNFQQCVTRTHGLTTNTRQAHIAQSRKCKNCSLLNINVVVNERSMHKALIPKSQCVSDCLHWRYLWNLYMLKLNTNETSIDQFNFSCIGSENGWQKNPNANFPKNISFDIFLTQDEFIKWILSFYHLSPKFFVPIFFSCLYIMFFLMFKLWRHTYIQIRWKIVCYFFDQIVFTKCIYHYANCLA